jgi:hypothetical protein
MTPSVWHVWRMRALPKILEEIVSELQMILKFFCFMWMLLMEVVSMLTLIYCGQLCNNAVNYPSTPLNPKFTMPPKKTIV